MLNSQRFSFIERTDSEGVSIKMPYLPITLSYREKSLETIALLDTGASVNVLPYELGLQLGAVWEDQSMAIQLSGNLAQAEARGLVLTGKASNLPSVLLAFAWTQSQNVPLILGHMNFFMEFDVCFYRADSVFDLRLRSTS